MHDFGYRLLRKITQSNQKANANQKRELTPRKEELVGRSGTDSIQQFIVTVTFWWWRFVALEFTWFLLNLKHFMPYFILLRRDDQYVIYRWLILVCKCLHVGFVGSSWRYPCLWLKVSFGSKFSWMLQLVLMAECE